MKQACLSTAGCKIFFVQMIRLVLIAIIIQISLYSFYSEIHPNAASLAEDTQPTLQDRVRNKDKVGPDANSNVVKLEQTSPQSEANNLTTVVVTNDGPSIQAAGGGPSTRPRRRKSKKIPRELDYGDFLSGDFVGKEERVIKLDNYPKEEIKRALNKTPREVKSMFNMINTALDSETNLTERVAHYHSDEDDVREEPICRSVLRDIVPREANRHNSIVYIANDQDFRQVIQAELCQSPGNECQYLQDALPYGFSSVCQQRYAYKKLLYLDPLEKRMSSDLFRYPSCCSCQIRISSSSPASPDNLRSGSANKSIAASPFEKSVDSASQSTGDFIAYNTTKIVDSNTTLIVG